MKTIGIVGGGITGLTCAYKLQNEFEVTLFERDDNLGGQAQTTVVNDINVEHAVSVVAETTYVEFFEIMREIGFEKFKPYALNGLHVHDRIKTEYYIDTNLRRLRRLLPKYIKDKPLGVVDTLKLVPFFNRMYADYRKGELNDVLVMDAYTKYPGYETLITTVLTILSLITSVQVKNTTISHVLNFIFDFENNKEYMNPLMQVINLFNDVTVPEGGVGAYVDKMRELTKAEFITKAEVTNVKRNPDSTVTVSTADDNHVTFDAVIIAAQPYQVDAFLEYKNVEEQLMFSRLAELITHSMVTNHTDEGILGGVVSTDGFVDFRLDYHENTSQTTIAREGHFYTAQTLPESYRQKDCDGERFFDTALTSDNYSIDKGEILSQHFHAVQHMTPETAGFLRLIDKSSGEDNLHFACAALSQYPTSQEGGVRSALGVVNKLLAV